MPPFSFSKNVLTWYDRHGRHSLPWQQDQTPYRVWISEIMLQQTQVNTVIPYFERFILRFPSIETLAEAPLDDVLGLWSGLGYYSRARNLHQSAKIIVERYQGHWPMDVPTLETLPGIGRSTAGAIISLSHNQFAPILDGNVKRVLTRFFAIADWPGNNKIQQMLWEKAEQLTAKRRVRDYNQAMMDLGATLCTRTKPRCLQCPLEEHCIAFQQSNTTDIPVTAYPGKKPKAIIPIIHKQFLLIYPKDKTAIWLYKRPPTGIWGGLWSLPELSMEETIEPWMQKKGFSLVKSKKLLPLKHIFSHFVLHIHPVHIIVDTDKQSTSSVMETSECGWYPINKSWPGGMPAPILKLIN